MLLFGVCRPGCAHAVVALLLTLALCGCDEQKPAAKPGATKPASSIVPETRRTAPPRTSIAPARRATPSHAATTPEATFTTPTMVVTGKTITLDGRPVSGALVRVVAPTFDTSPWRSVVHDQATTMSRPDGSFEIRLPAERDLFLAASAPRLCAETIRLTDSVRVAQGVSQGRKYDFEKKIVLRNTVTVSGSALLPGERPAAGAVIMARQLGSHGGWAVSPVTTTTADAVGSFTLDDVPPGKVAVRAETAGYAAALVSASAPADGLVLKLTRPASVFGRILQVRSGLPLPDAQLTLAPDKGQEDIVALSRTTTRTLSTGEFSFDALPEGTYAVAIRQGNPPTRYMRPVPGYEKLTLREGETTTGVILKCDEGRTLTGVVYDAKTSIPLAAVKYESLGRFGGTEQTTASGEFRICGIDRENFEFQGVKPGYYVLPETAAVAFPPGDNETSRTILMGHRVSLAGRVVSDLGTAIAGAKVTASSNMDPDSLTCDTDAEGRFDVAAVPRSRLRLKATATDLAPASTDEIEVPEAGGTVPDIVLGPGGSIVGRVVDETSASVEGAHVTAYTRDPDNSDRGPGIILNQRGAQGAPQELVTDASGAFRISHVPEGTITLEPQKKGYLGNQLRLKMMKAEQRTGVELRLDKLGEVTGVVLDETTSQPVAGARVWASDPGKESQNTGNGTTDQDGTFRIELVPVNTMQFVVRHPDYAVMVRKVTVDPAVPVKLMLAPKKDFALLGDVLDAASRQPIADFTATLDRDEASVAKVEKTGPGRFRMSGLRKESLGTVIVRAAGYGAASSAIMFLKPTQTEVHETFLMYPLVKVHGRLVRASDHQPVAGMKVVIQTDSSRSTGSDPAVSGADGRFTAEVASARGKYATVIITEPAENRPSVIKKLTIPDENEPDIGDIEVGATARIHGRVLRMPGDAPVPGELVTLSDLSKEWRATTDKNGDFEFTDVPAIQNSMLMVFLRDRSIMTNVTQKLQPGGDAEVIIRIGGTTLHGTVVRGGVPVQCNAMAGDFGESLQNVRGTPDGTFVIKDLAPGRLKLTLRPEDDPMHTYTRFVDVPEQESFEQTFVLPASRITGTILSADGKPAANVSGMGRRTGGGEADSTGGYLSLKSGDDGRYAVEGVEPGAYSLVVRDDRQGVATASCTVTEGKDTVLDIQFHATPATLVSDAYDFQSGEPLVYARLSVETEEGGLVTNGNVRDPNGRMRIEKLTPGTYNVAVSQDGYTTAKHTITLGPGETKELRDVLERAGSLEWTLKRRDGSPAPDVPVSLVPADPGSMQQPLSGKSDKRGIWNPGAILPGRYHAQATPLQGAPVTAEVTINARETARPVSVVP